MMCFTYNKPLNFCHYYSCFAKNSLIIYVFVHGFNIWSTGKNTFKGVTQVNEHFLKLHFCMFERSQVKHNNLDCHKFFALFSINYKFYMLKIWHKFKFFLHVENIQILRVDSLCIFQMSFFLPNDTIPSKIWKGF